MGRGDPEVICAVSCHCGYQQWYGEGLQGPWQTKQSAWDQLSLHVIEFRGVGMHA
jgi:hypothetical protein